MLIAADQDSGELIFWLNQIVEDFLDKVDILQN
jgi:hypothetical protein